jgi:Zinc finger, C3HC4 type (RING finger)
VVSDTTTVTTPVPVPPTGRQVWTQTQFARQRRFPAAAARTPSTTCDLPAIDRTATVTTSTIRNRCHNLHRLTRPTHRAQRRATAMTEPTLPPVQSSSLSAAAEDASTSTVTVAGQGGGPAWPWARTTAEPSPRPAPRARPSEQVRVVRELWRLREQARVQAAERHFLCELQRVLARAYESIAPLDGQAAAERDPQRGRRPRERPARAGSVDSDGEDESEVSSHDEDDVGPARERAGVTFSEVQHLRQQQRVTNLSPEFRALLEGTHDPPSPPAVYADDLLSSLSDQRAVTNALDSAFRHELEGIVARGDVPAPVHMYHQRIGQGLVHAPIVPGFNDNNHHRYGQHRAQPETADSDEVARQLAVMDRAGSSSAAPPPSTDAAIRALREEITVLKNVIGASFDMQLDIQRAIRQEVSAAMNASSASSARQQADDTDVAMTASAASSIGAASSRTLPITVPVPEAGNTCKAADNFMPARGGQCIVCLEAPVDSLLYGCGHMCSCSMCGRHLIASALPCPICRAPIRDVVRVYMATE